MIIDYWQSHKVQNHMYNRFRIFLTVLALSICTILQAQEDTVLYQKDGVIELNECISDFFENCDKVSSLGKTKLINKAGKLMTMTAFLTANKLGYESVHGLYDLDNDGKNELLIYNFTGGAHCCDEYFIFKNVGTDRYQYSVRLFGGDACVLEDNSIIYHFYQQFGYFFTCFACAYTDTSDAAPVPINNIRLRYSKGKPSVIPGDKELRSMINDNLAKLGEQPYEVLEDNTAQDNGLRKEFAMNLVVFYYSFGRNQLETQKLFNKFYKFPDAKKVWAEFIKHLQSIRKQSDF